MQNQPENFYKQKCFDNYRSHLPKYLKIIQSLLNQSDGESTSSPNQSIDENSFKKEYLEIYDADIKKLEVEEAEISDHKESNIILKKIKDLKKKKEKNLNNHKEIIQKILNQQMSEEEKNYLKFYRALNPSKTNEKAYLSELLEDLKNKDGFWHDESETKFDSDTYFKVIWCLRLLEHYQKNNNKVNENIPEIVKKYQDWYTKIGQSSESEFRQRGKDNLISLIDINYVPNWIKIHLISRFIMRRNRALIGKRNFENSSAIRDDGSFAIGKAEKLLKRAKNDRSHTPNFSSDIYTPDSIECGFNTQKMLFAVRENKDIDQIITITTNTLGLLLTSKNRILKEISSFWCYHVLWRCFLCNGDYESANNFKLTAQTTSRQLEYIHGIQYSKKFELYDESMPIKHKKYLIKIINAKEIPPYTHDTIKKWSEDGKNIFESREEFYVNFIGYDMHKRTISGSTKPLDLFKRRTRMDKGEQLIIEIAEYLNEVLTYLNQAPSIVSIPTIRLVIIDLLLKFSRISMYINNNMKKDIDNEQFKKGREGWEILVRSIKNIIKSISKIKNDLEIELGKDKIRDLKYIIEKLEDIIVGKNPENFNVIIGNSKERRKLFMPEKAGKEIQTILKELIDPQSEFHVPLHFPLKN